MTLSVYKLITDFTSLCEKRPVTINKFVICTCFVGGKRGNIRAHFYNCALNSDSNVGTSHLVRILIISYLNDIINSTMF